MVIFGTMSYFDYEEAEKLRNNERKVQGQIRVARKKQKEIKPLTEKLWIMQKKYNFFKKVLPNKTRFYQILRDTRKFSP